MKHHDCPTPEALGSVLLLEVGHPDRVAAENCPSCQATLLAYRDFVASGADDRMFYTDADAAELDRRRVQLATLDRARRPRLLAPAMLPAWALAAAAVVLLLVQARPGEPEISTALRGESAQDVAAKLDILPGGELSFSWPDQEGVESFAVQLLDAELRELKRKDAADRTSLRLSAAELASFTGAPPVLWRVLGVSSGDVVYRSSVAKLPPPDPAAPSEKSSAEP